MLGKRLPHPVNWQDFETACHIVWSKLIWNDPDAKMNGRTGQKQQGVDIFGRERGAGSFIGVQCKGKDDFAKTKISIEEIESEIEKADKFEPAISKLTFATTGQRDGVIQEAVRKLSEKREAASKFSVDIWFWDDISKEIEQDEQVKRFLYPEIFDQKGYSEVNELAHNEFKVSIYGIDVMGKIQAHLEDSRIRRLINPELRRGLVGVLFELIDNALRHGGARQVDIEIAKDTISLSYQGAKFDPFEKNEDLKSSGVGLLYVQSFQDYYKEYVNIRYSRHQKLDTNSIEIQFRVEMSDPQFFRSCSFAISRADAYNPGELISRLSESNCEVYYLSFSEDVMGLSMPLKVIHRALSAIPLGKPLAVVLPKDQFHAKSIAFAVNHVRLLMKLDEERLYVV